MIAFSLRDLCSVVYVTVVSSCQNNFTSTAGANAWWTRAELDLDKTSANTWAQCATHEWQSTTLWLLHPNPFFRMVTFGLPCSQHWFSRLMASGLVALMPVCDSTSHTTLLTICGPGLARKTNGYWLMWLPSNGHPGRTAQLCFATAFRCSAHEAASCMFYQHADAVSTRSQPSSVGIKDFARVCGLRHQGHTDWALACFSLLVPSFRSLASTSLVWTFVIFKRLSKQLESSRFRPHCQ